MKEYTNDLINESSPYLLQHAHNPVHWMAWSEEALTKAKKENKLIIVSIGYSACHWCHVMEHESFEDTVVANLMNKNYISIKVDREERPDIDQVYMDAAQLITGRGGWPLNVIALPDGRPIYAGTYFRKDQWMEVLKGVQDFYSKTPEKALEQAMQVAAGVNKMNYLPSVAKSELSEDALSSAATEWISAIDKKEGGRAATMKFPMPKAYISLLNYAVQYNNVAAKDAVLLTLDKMASGGIYDQLGGGFSRYSVDPLWHVPHFEKMLYDNAQLISLYSQAYKLTKDPFYRQVVAETIEFCNRELGAPENAYYSSLDADSEGEEGKFYVWSREEIDEHLGKDAELFNTFYGVSASGNWEAGKNVLKMSANLSDLKQKFDLSEEELSVKLKISRETLFNIRASRSRPGLDDKVLTSWNGLMISGLAHAFEAIGDENYRNQALATGEFIWSKMWDNGFLYRNRKNGKSTINGFLEDYAFTIMGFIDLYEISFDEEWLKRAQVLTDLIFKSFYDDQINMFQFKGREDEPLFVEKAVIEDNVIPSGNSAMAINLFRLGYLLYNDQYLNTSKQMLNIASESALKHAAFYYNWFELYLMHLNEPYEVAILGKNFEKERGAIAAEFNSNIILLGGSREGSLQLLQGKLQKDETTIYVCVNKTCKLPVKNASEALNQIEEKD